MQEFDLIAKYLAPLATGVTGAFALTDDAAVISLSDKLDMVVAKDAVTEGVHFLPDTDAADIARKLLRTNLSDMAAMGATPKYYLIAAILSDKANESWWKKFTDALAEEQKVFKVALIGGDTSRHAGAMSLSLTIIGEVPKDAAIRRAGAKAGDTIFVSGTIGDAALGLRELRANNPEMPSAHRKFLISRYNIPQPRVTLGEHLRGIANCAIDISDGLLADLGHICDCSSVGAIIYKERIPLSLATAQMLKIDNSLFEIIVTGGDDYELLFTVSQDKKAEVMALSNKLSLKLTAIGHIEKGTKVKLLDKNSEEILFARTGYQHFR